jgi:hypothetical protein
MRRPLDIELAVDGPKNGRVLERDGSYECRTAAAGEALPSGPMEADYLAHPTT